MTMNLNQLSPPTRFLYPDETSWYMTLNAAEPRCRLPDVIHCRTTHGTQTGVVCCCWSAPRGDIALEGVNLFLHEISVIHDLLNLKIILPSRLISG